MDIVQYNFVGSRLQSRCVVKRKASMQDFIDLFGKLRDKAKPGEDVNTYYHTFSITSDENGVEYSLE